MKKFDLEAAKNGAPIITRNGKPARIVCFDLKCSDYQLAAAVDYGDAEDVETYTVDGVFQDNNGDNSLDLFMAPVKKKGWLNIYPATGNGRLAETSDYIYDSEQEADRCSSISRIACVEIEWEE